MTKKITTNQTKTIVKDLLNKVGFPQAKLSISQNQEENQININIIVSQEDSGILIGFHGETISALQAVIGQILYKKTSTFQRVFIDIGDYREKREATLKVMALNAANRVKTTHQSLSLPYLASNERRIIHMELSQDPELETFSEGSGRDRRLVINLKSNPSSTQDTEESFNE